MSTELRKKFIVDHPIHKNQQDTLERANLAATFARHVLALPADHGLVVGIFGPWGSGKTSFINLAKSTFKETNATVLEFNPWHFSGTDQLVETFFADIAAQFENCDLKELAIRFDEIGEALGGRAGGAIRVAGICLGSRSRGLVDQRNKIGQILKQQRAPVIVVVDDVDRLSASEARDMFKLVRLTASFPNLIYILACDRKFIVQALACDGIVGQDYLEKIIQFSFDLPEIPRRLLKDQTLESIRHTLDGIENPGLFQENEWLGTFSAIIQPLIRNLRDLRRYCVAIDSTVTSLDGAVACVDVLALEAVRLFMPDVFQSMLAAIDELTVSPGIGQLEKEFEDGFNSTEDRSQKEDEFGYTPIDAMIQCGKPYQGIVEAVILRLFPKAALHWDHPPVLEVEPHKMVEERRVGHVLVLRRYLERVADPDLLDEYDAQKAYYRMDNEESLQRFFDGLDQVRLLNVIKNLRQYKNKFESAHAEPGIVVLLNTLPTIEGRQATLSNESEHIIGALVVTLLETIEENRNRTVVEILRKLHTLTARVILVERVGFRENIGKQLVSKDVIKKLETTLRSEIEAAEPDKLANERYPAKIISFVQYLSIVDHKKYTIPDSTKLMFALLQDYQINGHFFESDDRPGSTRHVGINWNNLTTIYGSEDLLKERLKSLVADFDSLRSWILNRVSSSEEASALIEKARNYMVE